MLRTITTCAAALLLLAFLSSSSFAIERVARRLNFIEFNAAYLAPVGHIDGFVAIPNETFPADAQPFDLDAADTYKGTYSLGVAIGQVYAGHLQWGLGFRYSKHQLKDTFDLSPQYLFIPDPDLSYNQYDVELNLNYYFTDVSRSIFSPYVGVGVATGILSGSYHQENYSESEGKALGALNFGFDLRLWQAENGRDMVALVSQNRYDILASEERPKYLTIGGALRFYIRP